MATVVGVCRWGEEDFASMKDAQGSGTSKQRWLVRDDQGVSLDI